MGRRRDPAPGQGDPAAEPGYLEKLDGSGYLSFTRSQPGPPCRRACDLDHRPTCEFERLRTVGFDPRDYGTDHHRADNILMTSTDEGSTWRFADDYIPWTLEPLTFPNMGSGVNPMITYAPDGSLVHITSQGWNGEPPFHRNPGGYPLCRFEGVDVSVDPAGTTTIDVSPIAKLEDVFVAKIPVTDSAGVRLADETVRRYSYSADCSRVSFPFEKTADGEFMEFEIVLANKSNSYRPVFRPRVEMS